MVSRGGWERQNVRIYTIKVRFLGQQRKLGEAKCADMHKKSEVSGSAEEDGINLPETFGALG